MLGKEFIAFILPLSPLSPLSSSSPCSSCSSRRPRPGAQGGRTTQKGNSEGSRHHVSVLYDGRDKSASVSVNVSASVKAFLSRRVRGHVHHQGHEPQAGLQCHTTIALRTARRHNKTPNLDRARSPSLLPLHLRSPSSLLSLSLSPSLSLFAAFTITITNTVAIYRCHATQNHCPN